MCFVGYDHLQRLSAWRYSTDMQTANELPKDLDTAHEVIVTQSGFIKELAAKNEKLEKELVEAQAAFAKTACW